MPVPRMIGSCEAHHDMEDGHFSCKLSFSRLGAPSEIPLRFISLQPMGCNVARLRCAGADAGKPACSRALFDVEVFAQEAQLVANVQLPGNYELSTPVATLNLTLKGPSRKKAAENATSEMKQRDNLVSLGLPRTLPQTSWSSSIKLVCQGLAEGLSPISRLASGNESPHKGNA